MLDINRFFELGHVQRRGTHRRHLDRNLIHSRSNGRKRLKGCWFTTPCTINNSYPACRRANSGKAAGSRRTVPRKRIGFITNGLYDPGFRSSKRHSIKGKPSIANAMDQRLVAACNLRCCNGLRKTTSPGASTLHNIVIVGSVPSLLRACPLNPYAC